MKKIKKDIIICIIAGAFAGLVVPFIMNYYQIGFDRSKVEIIQPEILKELKKISKELETMNQED